MSMTVKRRRGGQVQVASSLELLSLDQSILEKVITYFVSFAFVDRASVAAIKGTCKRLRNAADSESVWKKISVVNGTNLNLDAVALKEIKCSGTEGTCMMVEEKGTKTMFALKRARPFDENEGVPYFLLREVSYLKALAHPNIAPLLGISLKARKLFLLFPYVECTLLDVLEQRAGSAFPGQTGGLGRKHAMSLAAQLLSAVSYCHARGIMHRNIKPKHLLLRLSGLQSSGTLTSAGTATPTHRGDHSEDQPAPESQPSWDLAGAQLLLTDFALLRKVPQPAKTLTSDMISLWYRPPELLMGVRGYGTAADMWSVGCVIAEMLKGVPLFPGASQIEQLFVIFSTLGTPTDSTWPEFTSAPYFTSGKFPVWSTEHDALRSRLQTVSSVDLDLLRKCLVCRPESRSSAAQLLSHPSLAAATFPSSLNPASYQMEEENDAHCVRLLEESVRRADPSMRPSDMRRFCAGKDGAWRRRCQLLSDEKRSAVDVEKVRVIRENQWFQAAVATMRCLHNARGRDCRGRSLSRAVHLLEAFLLLPEEVRNRAVAESGRAVAPSDQTDSGALATEVDCAVITACLQVASKLEDVAYMEAAELRESAAAELVARRLNAEQGVGLEGSDQGESDAADDVESVILAVLARSRGDVSVAVEEGVLRALEFRTTAPTVRDFVGMLLEETCCLFDLLMAGGTERSTALQRDPVSIAAFMPDWDSALSRRRWCRGWLPGWEAPVRALSELLVTQTAGSVMCVEYTPSLQAAAIVWLSMRVFALFVAIQHETAVSLKQGGTDNQEALESPVPVQGLVEQTFAASLETWSGHSLAALRESVSAVWAVLEFSERAEAEDTHSLMAMRDGRICNFFLLEIVSTLQERMDLLLGPLQ